MEKREALEVHRGRNKKKKIKRQIIMRKHENFIKNMHKRRLWWVRRTVIRCHAFPMGKCNQH